MSRAPSVFYALLIAATAGCCAEVTMSDAERAQAFVWQAEEQFSPNRPLTTEVLEVAESQLQQAVALDPESDPGHRLLGEIHYFRYIRADSRDINQTQHLSRAEYHLSKVAAPDIPLLRNRVEIHTLFGQQGAVEADAARILELSEAMLKAKPDDLSARLDAAEAYRILRRFDDAVLVLQEGKALEAAPVYDDRIADTHYYRALDLRQNNPLDRAGFFSALKDAYRASSANRLVVRRFVTILTATDAAEATAAREALRELAEEKPTTRMAPFLLGFDYLRRNESAEAERLFQVSSRGRVDGSLSVIVFMAAGAREGRNNSITPETAKQLPDVAARIWPY